MKRVVLSIIATLLIILLSSGAVCHFGMEPLLYDYDHPALYSMATFCVAGSYSAGTKIKPIETDSFGRVLFEIKFAGENMQFFYLPQGTTDGWLYAYAICQKTDSLSVYYYEDDAFVVCSEQDNFDDYQKNALKQRNDWGKPIDIERLTFRNIFSSVESRIGLTENYSSNQYTLTYCDDVFQSFVPLAEEEHMGILLLDVDAEGKMLYCAWVYTDNKEPFRDYFMIMPPGPSIYLGAVVEPIENPLEYYRELKEFKAENDWISP